MDEWLVTIIGSVVTVIATLGSVLLGARLTQGHGRRERLIELRRIAYSDILSRMSEIEARLDWVAEMIAEDAVRYFNGPAYRSNDDHMTAQMHAAHKRFRDDYLILSPAFIASFEAMVREITAGEVDSIPPVVHEAFDLAIRKARPELLRIAKEEISSVYGS